MPRPLAFVARGAHRLQGDQQLRHQLATALRVYGEVQRNMRGRTGGDSAP